MKRNYVSIIKFISCSSCILVVFFSRRGLAVDIVRRNELTEHFIKSNDMILTVGGDGTFLSAASKVPGRSKPVIGINSDPLRFLPLPHPSISCPSLTLKFQPLPHNLGSCPPSPLKFLPLSPTQVPASPSPLCLHPSPPINQPRIPSCFY